MNALLNTDSTDNEQTEKFPPRSRCLSSRPLVVTSAADEDPLLTPQPPHVPSLLSETVVRLLAARQKCGRGGTDVAIAADAACQTNPRPLVVTTRQPPRGTGQDTSSLETSDQRETAKSTSSDESPSPHHHTQTNLFTRGPIPSGCSIPPPHPSPRLPSSVPATGSGSARRRRRSPNC